MTNKEQLAEKEFKEIDQALRRAAQTAQRLASQNGTPLVVAEARPKSEKQTRDANQQ